MSEDSVAGILHLFYKRHDVFRCLCDDVFDKQAVQERTGASRPTVDRAFRELEDAGILTSEGTVYELTNFGDLCCVEFERVAGTLETLTEVEGLFSHLPRDAGFDMRLLDGAEVHHAEDHAPHEPLTEMVDLARSAGEFYGYSNRIIPYIVEGFHRLTVEEAVPARLVLSEEVVETGLANYPEKFGAIVEADTTTVYATEHAYNYGAAVGGGRVAVSVSNDMDRLLAVVTNDTDAAVEWVEEFLDEIVASDRTREL
jgi:predicted transcriptional regulator